MRPLLHLLPLSLNELIEAGVPLDNPFELITAGFYPRLYKAPIINIYDWHQNYVRTYIERDVRSIKIYNGFIQISALHEIMCWSYWATT